MADAGTVTPEEIAERLKDAADDLGLSRLLGTLRTGPHTWTRIEVSHAAGLSDSPDGWDVAITEDGL